MCFLLYPHCSCDYDVFQVTRSECALTTFKEEEQVKGVMPGSLYATSITRSASWLTNAGGVRGAKHTPFFSLTFFFFFFFCSSWSIMWGLFLTFLFFWWIQIYMAWNLFLHFLVAKRKHVFKPCAVQHKYIIAVKLKLYSWILFLLKHKI
jgi:hypothetical protein